ncbi:hypothetical protein XNC3_2740022 [Xenorhabdus nematophila F1]|nr:hypothetical protein XNC3_2740022 [Xenorhabdus nematophila F1]
MISASILFIAAIFIKSETSHFKKLAALDSLQYENGIFISVIRHPLAPKSLARQENRFSCFSPRRASLTVSV